MGANTAEKLDPKTIKVVKTMYRKKTGKHSKLHNALIAASGYASLLVFIMAVLCVETSTLKAMLVASVALAWFMLFMLVNVDILNRRIERYWRTKRNERV